MEQEFSAVVRSNQSMVFSVALNFFRDRPLAEEISQDVFLQLYRHLDTLESPAHVENWLRRVTVRKCIDESRRRKFRRTLALEAVPEPRAETHSADPLRDQMLRRLVATLPERPRMIVVLRFQEGLEPAEIAEAVGVPIGTVKSQLHRALAVLRTKLERMEKGAIA